MLMVKEDTQPLLTIAIPTWNRAELLTEALKCLEPQIAGFEDDIEIVISDNASTDNTPTAIRNFSKRQPELRVKSFRQKENTGYFGNFKKVRELSTGKYLWILSDDDHVQNNIISHIVGKLKKNKEICIIFLDVWDTSPKNKFLRVEKEITWEELIINKGYRITLISAVIFLNNKEHDNYLFEKYTNNSFIGFLLFLATYQAQGTCISIKGYSLKTSQGVVSFNIYDSWLDDMGECLDFFSYINISQRVKNYFVNNYIKHVIHIHFINTILYGYCIDEKEQIKGIFIRIKASLKEYKNYWGYLYLVFISPKLILKIYNFIRKVINYFKVRITSILISSFSSHKNIM